MSIFLLHKSLAAHFVPLMTDSASSLPELATGFSYRVGDANDLSEAWQRPRNCHCLGRRLRY